VVNFYSYSTSGGVPKSKLTEILAAEISHKQESLAVTQSAFKATNETKLLN